MSQDRFAADDVDPTRYARCKAQPRDVYTKLYLGRQRPPRLADEAGAVCVVECVFGGRVRIYRIDGDKDHRRVELDRDWRPPGVRQ